MIFFALFQLTPYHVISKCRKSYQCKKSFARRTFKVLTKNYVNLTTFHINQQFDLLNNVTKGAKMFEKKRGKYHILTQLAAAKRGRKVLSCSTSSFKFTSTFQKVSSFHVTASLIQAQNCTWQFFRKSIPTFYVSFSQSYGENCKNVLRTCLHFKYVFFNLQVGLSRSTTGCVAACLFRDYQISASFEGLIETVPGINLDVLKLDRYTMDPEKDTLFRGEFEVVKELIAALPDGAVSTIIVKYNS